MNLMSKDAAEAAIPTEQEMVSEKKSENSAPKLTLQEGAVSKKGSSLSLRKVSGIGKGNKKSTHPYRSCHAVGDECGSFFYSQSALE